MVSPVRALMDNALRCRAPRLWAYLLKSFRFKSQGLISFIKRLILEVHKLQENICQSGRRSLCGLCFHWIATVESQISESRSKYSGNLCCIQSTRVSVNFTHWEIGERENRDRRLCIKPVCCFFLSHLIQFCFRCSKRGTQCPLLRLLFVYFVHLGLTYVCSCLCVRGFRNRMVRW